jgi:protein XagA
MKKLLIFLLLLSLSVSVMAGGGWPQPKGKGYFKLAQNWIISNSFYGPKGDIVSIRTTGLYTTSLYAEYGFSNRLTGLLYFPFFVRNTLNEIQFKQSGIIIPGEFLNAVGDTELGIKYGLITDKPIVVSVSAILGLPFGETGGGAVEILQTGDGEFNQMVRIDASHSFYPLPIYVSAYVALNNRTKNFSDEYRFGMEAGYTWSDKLIAIAKLNVVQSFYNGSDRVADNGIFSNNTEYISPTIELNYQLTEKWGISSSGGFAWDGKNILAAPNWGVGVYLKL